MGKHDITSKSRDSAIVNLLIESLPKEDLLRLSKKIAQQLGNEPVFSGNTIPVEIFSFELSPAESLVKYMKENMEQNFHEIGGALCRDERGIWGSYNRAKKKMGDAIEVQTSEAAIPLDIFKDRNKSVMEAVIIHLHDELQMKFSKIAKLLNKKYSTVYTTYLRAKQKPESKGGRA